MNQPLGYFVRIRGRVTGPFRMEELQRMARLGTLSRAAEVSPDKSRWGAADSVAEIFRPDPLAAARREVDSLPPEPLLTPDPLMILSQDIQATQAPPAIAAKPKPDILCVTQGICTAALLLFCVMVPHTRRSGELGWWWDLLALPGGVALFCTCLVGILLAGALAVASLAMKESGRATTYVAASLAGTLALGLAAALGPNAGAALAVAALAPLPMACLAGTTLLEIASPGSRAKPLQLPSAVLTVAIALAAGALCEWTLVGQLRGGAPPAWAITAIALTALGWCGAMAAGILGAVHATRLAASSALAKRVVVLVFASAGVLVLASAAGGVSTALGREEEGSRFLLVQAMKLVVSACALAATGAIGALRLAARKASPPPAGQEGPTDLEIT